MLFGRIFRSSVAHGRIRSIDTSAAQAMLGVYRIVTSDDVRKVIPHRAPTLDARARHV
jgi:CO/xanthine dehydrogenase Mo-binding subunit